MMFRDEVMEKYYYQISEKKIPINTAVVCIDILEDVLAEIRRDEPYAELSRLFYE